MQKLYLFILLIASSLTHAQPLSSSPASTGTGTAPNWLAPTKAEGDSCGAYFNKYVEFAKTSVLYFEPVRTGGIGDFDPYTGRGQRFHAPQPIEVSGVQFYGFQTNPDLDSIMVVTLLYDYLAASDSVGAELARDTTWVKHTAFTPLLADIEVNSYFDAPITVTEDYIVGFYTPTNDSLKVLTNSAADGDGDGEGVSFLYYDNPAAPGFTGWYSALTLFGPAYDIDYLINPLVKYDLHEDFELNTDTVCPNVISAACVDYTQMPIFSDPHYNALSDTPEAEVNWNWGDGLQNTALLSLCHTYTEPGSYEIVLTDSLRRHLFGESSCTVSISKSIEVLDSAVADFIFTTEGLTAFLVGGATHADSVSWIFGDGETSTEESPEHKFETVGSFDVWFYAYGPCNTDSVMQTVTVDDVGIAENNLRFDLFPNPANTHLTIAGIQAGSTIELINTLGATLVRQTALSTDNFVLSTADLANGTYFVRVVNEQGQGIEKLVVKH